MTEIIETEQSPSESLRAASSYRWVMLLTGSLTGMLVYAIPALSLPVLFPEISVDLNLSIVQVGIIWAIGSFSSVFIVLIGGLLGDRLGTRRILITACLLSGILGSLRGFTTSFNTFLVASFFFGLVQPIIPVNLHKLAGEWFPRRQLGLATAIISTGIASGLMLGSLLSASVLSPATGGWQGVMFVYGLVAILMAGVWFIIHPKDGQPADQSDRPQHSLRDGLAHIARLRSIWILGFGVMLFWACTRGFVGFLPTYLRDIGWSGTQADRTLAVYYAFSMVSAIPFAILTDRLQLRRQYLIFACLMAASGAALMTFAVGPMVWVAVIIGGFIFDGFMAIFQATVLQVKGVGFIYAGTALGFAAMLREMGGVFSPPIGNRLSITSTELAFLFWAVMGFLGAIAFVIYLKKGWDR